ncbi:methylmalonyl-CoA mutase [Flaviramulus basaltis]|uniref:Methylmalonyl-CoA mutase n=1 Tax=Flaviramulus basaltis TaxID=369401 RepID=A0A1K2INS2_9FLAO|nr:methylmalonyl-CoA mutase subunit beta [Flaviramulus basaltis]SFZ93339.1 methylmalonyl-CoA mutase [Flaviramulus basaltis]
MSTKLFSEFNSVSSKQWKQKIQFDLKGADYNDTLVWKTNEDISVKPFYHSDDFNELPEISNTKATQWKICQSIFVADVEKSNLKAINAIERGAESIQFIIPTEDISIENLIKNIDLDKITLHLKLQFLSENFTKKLSVISAKAGIYTHLDIIENLTKTGNWFNSLKEDFQKFENITKITNSFTIDTSIYQNAGATMVQQLAYGLAHANEYLNILDEKSSKLNAIFKVSIGTNYFFEIAKLRALRKLWDTLASEYNINKNCQIIATPTKRNKTLYDYNTNMLRTTTECMSAILGGANTICNLPYDAIYHKDNKFGERIARNQLLILKHESYFNKVDNPSDGSYYIENLTNQLAEKALDLFKNIEANGGFLNQLKEGTIQRKIKESAAKEQQQFNDGEEVLLGTNIHPNTNDKMKNELEIYPFVKTNQKKTLIEPIIEKRLAENLEQKRLKNEN